MLLRHEESRVTALCCLFCTWLMEVAAPPAPTPVSHFAAMAVKKGFEEDSMGNNLFVGNLPYDVDDTQLSEIFSQAGTVTSAHVVTDKFSGQSRGYGFVEMSSDAEAAQAVTMLNGQDLRGRAMTVNEARPREERSSYRGGGGGGDRRGGGGGGYGDRRGGGGGGYGGGRGGDRRGGNGGGRGRY